MARTDPDPETDVPNVRPIRMPSVGQRGQQHQQQSRQPNTLQGRGNRYGNQSSHVLSKPASRRNRHQVKIHI
jgi:hypothetical protein